MNLFEMSAREAKELFLKLGVDPKGKDKDALRKAYRKLMMAHHPDKGGDVELAKQISQAFDILTSAPHTEAPSRSSGGSQRAFSMDHPRFDNIDYVRWWFDQKTEGVETQKWWVMNFDGAFFRNSFTVSGNSEFFADMARIMPQWDRHYSSAAVLAGTRSMLEAGNILLIGTHGRPLERFETLEFDSPNLNPCNDQHFCRKLPEIIARVRGEQLGK